MRMVPSPVRTRSVLPPSPMRVRMTRRRSRRSSPSSPLRRSSRPSSRSGCDDRTEPSLVSASSSALKAAGKVSVTLPSPVVRSQLSAITASTSIWARIEPSPVLTCRTVGLASSPMLPSSVSKSILPVTLSRRIEPSPDLIWMSPDSRVAVTLPSAVLSTILPSMASARIEPSPLRATRLLERGSTTRRRAVGEMCTPMVRPPNSVREGPVTLSTILSPCWVASTLI